MECEPIPGSMTAVPLSRSIVAMTSDTTTAGRLALLGAAALLALAGIHLTHGPFDGTYDEPIAYANDICFTLSLLLTIPALLALRAHRDAPAKPVLAIAIGQGLVAAGVIAGLAMGGDFDGFAVFGIPGNLAAWGGFIALAIWTWRTGAFAEWVAVLMALAVPVGLAGAEIGGSILPAVLWLALGSDLLGRPARNRTLVQS